MRALAVAEPVAEWLHRGRHRLSPHSAFTRVLNLRSDEGQLISLISEGLEDGPFSIRLPLSSLSSLSDSLFLSDERTLTGSTLRIEWADAPRWNPLLAAGWLRVDERTERLARRVAGCLAESDAPLAQGFFSLFPFLTPASSAAPTPSTSDLWQQAGTARLAHLHDALRQQDERWLDVAARALLGWGSGLTPAGDDCLLGLLAGRRMLGQESTRFRATLLDEAATQTTTLSAALLRSASQGHFAASWHGLGAALKRRDGLAVEAATRLLMAYGASSGTDALVGWLLALLPFFQLS